MSINIEYRKEMALSHVSNSRWRLVHCLKHLTSPEVDELIELYPEGVQGTLDDVCDLVNEALAKLHHVNNRLTNSRNGRLSRRAKAAREMLANRKKRRDRKILREIVEDYQRPPIAKNESPVESVPDWTPKAEAWDEMEET